MLPPEQYGYLWIAYVKLDSILSGASGSRFTRIQKTDKRFLAFIALIDDFTTESFRRIELTFAGGHFSTSHYNRLVGS